MTYTEAIALINQWIITNGNNEITAAVLNPVLEAIVNAASDTTGQLSDLTTSDTSNLVAAINEINQALSDITTTGIQLYTGGDNPNDTPPAIFSTGDFYIQTGTNTIFQYNGSEWVNNSITIPMFDDVVVVQKGYGNTLQTAELGDYCNFNSYDSETNTVYRYEGARWVAGTLVNNPDNFDWVDRKKSTLT